MSRVRAEVIAIGDELTSGQRLDTNSQWLSQRLTELGIETGWHTTVRDDAADQTAVFAVASRRAEIIVVTGGLGPTADDLTRQVLADFSGMPLARDQATVNHIAELFESYGREMPASNVVQADFPEGSLVIPNSEGTAPGIDLAIDTPDGKCRFFCLPGVPAEMYGMWHDYVSKAILAMGDRARFIEQRVINCFGAGESQIEGMLPGMIIRGRQPRVGITASMATISLRISATGNTAEECRELADRDQATICESLGELVFGFGEQTLEQVLIERLLKRNATLAVCDFGLSGLVAQSLASADPTGKAFRGGIFAFVDPDEKISFQRMQSDSAVQSIDPIVLAARNSRVEFAADLGLAIGPIESAVLADATSQKFKVAIVGDELECVEQLKHVGHSGLRLQRSVKQVLNFARLRLA